MSVKQLSIFVENKPGQLAEITSVLAQNKIDIRAMSVADTQDFGILRLIVSDIEGAKAALSSNSCVVSVNSVVAVAISDKPGALMKAVSVLSDNEINIEYMYAFITTSGQHAYVVMRVTDNERAEELLCKNGIDLVTQQDINNL
ncbi:MAG: ACT domain-containing protein [bacterium]|nr:ACT domain-containing protein [bacterium]